jgi:hypothetical protein
MATAVKDIREIQRVKLVPADEAEQIQAEVMKKAYGFFGYRADGFIGNGPLTMLLQKLEIEPLNTEQVRAYMKSKEKRLMNGETRWMLVRQVVIVALCASLFRWIQWGMIFPAVFISGFNLVWWALSSKVTRQMVWKKFDLGNTAPGLENYTRSVPLHVLNHAVQIREEMRTAEFVVHELTREEDRIPSPLADPFLEVRHYNERYFIDVWDERDFEKKQ